MTSAFLFALLAAPQQAQYTDIHRVFAKNETLNYEVTSKLTYRSQEIGQAFGFTNSTSIDYGFTVRVLELKEEGFALVRYNRPEMTITEGETAARPPLVNKEKVDMRFDMSMSPANEITNVKELAAQARLNAALGTEAAATQDILGQFIGELQRLALFVGSIDSAIDLSPRLPYDEVRPGDTWKRTVGYQPQRLQGSDSSAVQRLDYIFKYEGIVESNGQKVHRITSTLDFKSNVAEFVNQMMGTKPSESGLEAVNMALKANITYDLDLNTRHTIRASARSEGGFDIRVSEAPGTPVYAEDLNGRSSLKLVKRTL